MGDLIEKNFVFLLIPTHAYDILNRVCTTKRMDKNEYQKI